MDAEVLREIIKSYSDANIVQSNKYLDVSKETLLCIQSDAILHTLCTSLSNLLCYKTSKEAYQRYSIRLLIIDLLRKWCQTTSGFKHLKALTVKENNLKLVTILLRKYFTDDALNKCDSEDTLLRLALSTMYLSVKNTTFINYTDRLLVRILHLETNNCTKNLIHNALCSNLHLRLSTKEEIYTSQRIKLIEEPLLNNFVCTFPNLKSENPVDDRNNEMLNKLLELSAKSARIFQLMFNFLKELLIQLQYAPVVLDFTSTMLKRISLCCENYNKDILDLYPRKLRFCILLLRITPKYHTAETLNYTLQIVKEIHNENKGVSLILMSHFLEWFECFATYVGNDM
ncbi:hypothetical protein PUN28_000834 [Cardiocondyla obscurior]|uniref:Uncharacterized protein n=1 Tax=Cardiocondyla obscurior TaxID=286306 RepID=A0AAW2H1R1_9HYME